MPKITPRLKEATFMDARPESKPYRIYDGEGLVMLVRPTGRKVWQVRYRNFDNK